MNKIFVIKRDGRKIKYNTEKIYNAVRAAAKHNSGDLSLNNIDRITELTETKIFNKLEKSKTNEVSVEEIQNLVIESLKELNFVLIANLYGNYRYERDKMRETNSDLANIINKIGIETDRDNANVGNNFSAKLLRIASEANKWHILLKVLPKHLATPHETGDYYIHDLDSYNLTINCLHISTSKLLANGFNTGYGTINSPKHIEVAAALCCILMQSSQNDMFGGQSHPNFDNDLAPYVEKTRVSIRSEYKLLGLTGEELEKKVEESTRKKVDQAMQAVVFNLNTMHARAGAQVPFSSVNIGLVDSKDAEMICESFLKQYDIGLGKGEQPIFPNIIFRVKKGVNRDKNDPYYNLFKTACEVASRRMNPTFMNIDADFNKKYYDQGLYPATMGCRTYLMSNVNGKPGVEGRGNNAPVTINIVRLGILAEKNIDNFFELLDKKIDLAHEQLMHRFNILKKLKVKDLPFVAGQKLMLGSENLELNDSILPIMLNGTFGIGFIGLAETLIALTGKHHGEDEESRKLGIRIIQHLRNRCDEITQKEKLNFSCYATPAEGLSGKFTTIDNRVFGNIKDVTDHEFYTNSFHVPVDYKISIGEKIKIEAPYHALCNAGHISYVEFDSYPTPDDIERIVVYAYENSNINYIGINFHIRYCVKCSG